jgi:cytidylate kinase
MQKKMAIAIDGPAGSGKSTVAKLLASNLHYLYIDTGAMYRALTLKSLRGNGSLAEPDTLTALAETTDIRLINHPEAGTCAVQVLLDGEDVSDPIRSLEVTDKVSLVAAIPGVRKALIRLQRQMAENTSVVMDGRDIGTVVLPQADLKVFLTASPEERGKRRWMELNAKGIACDLAEQTEQIRQRDYLDSHREFDPLRQAADAVLIDSTGLSVREVVARIQALAVEKGAVVAGN